jgi:hypothetical protein
MRLAEAALDGTRKRHVGIAGAALEVGQFGFAVRYRFTEF